MTTDDVVEQLRLRGARIRSDSDGTIYAERNSNNRIIIYPNGSIFDASVSAEVQRQMRPDKVLAHMGYKSCHKKLTLPRVGRSGLFR